MTKDAVAVTHQQPKLSAAIVAAQRAAKAVGKDSSNQFHRYAYASGEAVIGVAKEAMGLHGLSFLLLSYEIEPLQPHDMLIAEYLLLHESGERLSISSATPIVPEKGRPADKAVAAAKTYDLAYTLRGVLALPRVDGDSVVDVDARDDTAAEPAPRPDRRKTVAKKTARALARAGVMTGDEASVAAAKSSVKLEVARLGKERVRSVAHELHGDLDQSEYTPHQWAELATELGNTEPMREAMS